MALEPFVVHRAVASRLMGDATLQAQIGQRVYLRRAPQGATFPYLRHQPMSQLPDNALGPERCGAAVMWLTALVTKGERWQALEAAANRVDALLQGWQPTAEGKTMLWVLDEWPEPPDDTVDGVVYQQFISIWRVDVQAA